MSHDYDLITLLALGCSVRVFVCGTQDEDARKVCFDEASTVMKDYVKNGGIIYNGGSGER